MPREYPVATCISVVSQEVDTRANVSSTHEPPSSKPSITTSDTAAANLTDKVAHDTSTSKKIFGLGIACLLLTMGGMATLMAFLLKADNASHGDRATRMCRIIHVTPTAQAPSTTQKNDSLTTTVVDNIFLEYGFFEGYWAPTPEEIEGVLEQTNRFYTMVLADFYGDYFVSFVAESRVASFCAATDSYPVRIDFDATVSFAANISTLPSRDQIVTNMQRANLDEYIIYFVWEVPGTSLFFDTQRVRDGRKQQTIVYY